MERVQSQVLCSDCDLLFPFHMNYPKHVTFQHVEGHQGTTQRGKHVSIEPQLNILMEAQATDAHTDPNVTHEARYTINIQLNGKLLTGKLKT
jgi:hypothetical protein